MNEIYKVFFESVEDTLKQHNKDSDEMIKIIAMLVVRVKIEVA